MNGNKPQARHGFTLIEVMVATVIIGITVAAVATVMRTGVRAWRDGHNMSEVGQTVRITQDMIERDLDNIFWMPETSYNNAFRAQIDNMARTFQAQIGQRGGDASQLARVIEDARGGGSHRRRSSSHSTKDEGGQHDAMDDISLDTIAPPLNLSFHGGGGDLSFARSYRPRYQGDTDTWGLRRVTYFVRDKVLYRKEEDPYGLRMGSNQYGAQNAATNAAASTAQANNNPDTAQDPTMLIRDQLQRLFLVPDQADIKDGDTADAAAASLLPTQVRIEEPLCSGVESLKISYGFFIDGNWQEDQKWDSQSTEHRTPPQPEDDPDHPDKRKQDMQKLVSMGLVAPGALNGMYHTDDLPGYIAIQLGVKPTGGKRVYQYTIYHSLPEGQEYDEKLDDQNGAGPGFNTRNHSTGGFRR